jgi:hypothetical protein
VRILFLAVFPVGSDTLRVGSKAAARVVPGWRWRGGWASCHRRASPGMASVSRWLGFVRLIGAGNLQGLLLPEKPRVVPQRATIAYAVQVAIEVRLTTILSSPLALSHLVLTGRTRCRVR